jgi:hypothetical protein
MRKPDILILTILAITLIAIPSAQAENYTPLLRVKVSDIYLTAGEENTIEIELRNTGSYSVYEVEAILTPTTSIVILDKGHMIFNEIEADKSKRYRPVIYVDEDTPLGPYQLTLSLTYRQMYKLGTAYIHSTTLQIGVIVVNATKPRIGLKLSLIDPHLTAGEEGKVYLEVRNRGSKVLKDIKITLTSNTPYIAVLNGVIDIDSLDHDEVERIEITLAVSGGTPLGVYTLTAAATYRDERGESHMEVETLGVNVDEVRVEKQTVLTLEGYSSSSEEVHPGELVNLTLNLRCVGAEAYDVKVMLSPDSIGVFSLTTPSLLYLGDLKPEEAVEAVYRLRVDGEAPSGQYSLTARITYLDSKGLPGSTVETVTLMVAPLVEFRILLEGELRIIEGEASTLLGDLLLIGTESARFVEVEIVEDGVFSKGLGGKEYIGALDPDSPLPFDLGFRVSEEAEEGFHMLSVRVSYLDYLNRRQSTILNIPVYVEFSPEVETVKRRGGLWFWIRWLLGILPR